MPKQLTQARGRLTWIQVSFSFSFCVDLIAVASGDASPSARYLRLEGGPRLVRTYPWHSPVARSGRTFPASRNTEKAAFWMRNVLGYFADVKDSDGDFACH